jgi:hypothetical protein
VPKVALIKMVNSSRELVVEAFVVVGMDMDMQHQ